MFVALWGLKKVGNFLEEKGRRKLHWLLFQSQVNGLGFSEEKKKIVVFSQWFEPLVIMDWIFVVEKDTSQPNN